MAGGVGSRFWPASREAKPKQFLDILGIGKSLLQMTYDRFLPLIPKENIFIVSNAAYKNLIKAQLPDVTDNQILSEPSRNNTAPCLAYMALKLHALNPDATFVVASSDHLILKEDIFLKDVKQALDFASAKDTLVTLGIEPKSPNTGYGYIQYNRHDANKDGIYKVVSFKEKPNLESAKEFLKAGNYIWNAGIFIWSVKSLLKSFKRNAEDIYDILKQGEKLYNTEGEQDFINEYYPATRSTSIDYAILEKADNVYTIPGDFGWSDLGTWGALYDESKKNEEANVFQSDNVLAFDTTNCLVRVPSEKLVVLRGLDDFIVVDENNTLLIFPKSKEQEIKLVTEAVKKWKGSDYL
ncbi:MAG: mannose-1-phosphate guanylyltransferase [Saprospiraceae bacterium]|nr:mannose-1-phosphate guanylyltransferase [Saprospiraceae bacterium]